MMKAPAACVAAALAIPAFTVAAQTPSPTNPPARRIASPPGETAAEVGGRHDERAGYVGGKWLEIRYGRPIKRGRNLFGLPDYVDWLNDGAPVWRAGANMSTRLNTEVTLVIGGKTVAPGEYTMFIDLAGSPWTFILSRWPAATTLSDDKNRQGLYGAYDYTPDRDVARLPMNREKLTHSFEQLSWQFLDMTETGGRLAMIWDKEMASVPFQIKK
jgi:hypothetical protein